MSTYTMRRVGKHLKRIDGIWLEGAMEYQESSEAKLAFNFCPVKFVDLGKKNKRKKRETARLLKANLVR